MRTFVSLIALICLLGFNSAITRAADAQQTTITGVVIDQACAAKMMTKDDPEKAAAGHPKSCATAEACEKSGYGVISGKEMIKFDDNGNKLAKDFLAKTTKDDNLRVKVTGTRDGDHIAVTDIAAAD